MLPSVEAEPELYIVVGHMQEIPSVSTFMRLKNKRDLVFIMCHVLRCICFHFLLTPTVACILFHVKVHKGVCYVFRHI